MLPSVRITPPKDPAVPHPFRTSSLITAMPRWLLTCWLLAGCLVAASAGEAATSVVLMIAEDEYDTRTTLPEFAASELAPRGLHCTTVFADPTAPNEFPGLETALPDADLLVVSVRRRTPTTAQMALIRHHLDAGKALVGIRTASHAFGAKPADDHHAGWMEFDHDVLGGSYNNHYGNEAATLGVEPDAAAHPVLGGVDVAALTTTRLYKNMTLAATATPLLFGVSSGKDERQHVAWVNQAGKSRVFYTSLGTPGDFAQSSFRRLLRNAVFWSLGRPTVGP